MKAGKIGRFRTIKKLIGAAGQHEFELKDGKSTTVNVSNLE